MKDKKMNAPDTKLAVTLFNLRDYCKTAEDLDTTLGRVREIGYQAIQISGIGPIAPETVKELLDKHELFCCATHEGMPNLKEHLDDIIAKMKLWNCDFTALGAPGAEYRNAEGVRNLIADLETAGEKLKANGLKLGYHNHHFEFQKYTDKTMLAEIYDNSDPEKLYAEIDVHWVTRGGENPVKWIKKVAGRMPVVHFKDFAIVDGEPRFCEVGEGNLDWEAIIKACEETGVRWYSIEQDQTFKDRDIFDSIKLSFDNLRAMGVK